MVLGRPDRSSVVAAADRNEWAAQVDIVWRQSPDLADPRAERELKQCSVAMPTLEMQQELAGLLPLEDHLRFALALGSVPLGLDRAADHDVVGDGGVEQR